MWNSLYFCIKPCQFSFSFFVDDGVYKNMKSVTLRNRIDDHDFQTKLSNIFKWLEKGQVVRAVIQNVAKDQAKSVSIQIQILKLLD